MQEVEASAADGLKGNFLTDELMFEIDIIYLLCIMCYSIRM